MKLTVRMKIRMHTFRIQRLTTNVIAKNGLPTQSDFKPGGNITPLGMHDLIF